MFIHVDKVTGGLVGTSEKNNISYDGAYSVELPDTDFFPNWWDYKYIDGKLVDDTSNRADQIARKKAEAGIRIDRDQRLLKTDWIVVKHNELGTPIPQEWLDYRQALRDITEQSGFPDNVEWPTAPSNHEETE